MKILFFILFLSLGYANCYGQTMKNNVIASCCEGGRGCTGSAYCTACKNCSGCKHCAKNGGTCGVCRRGSSKSYTTYKKSSNSHRSTSNLRKYLKDDNLTVNSTTLNLREGPGTKYKILEKLNNNSTLLFIENKGTWLKIKVKETGTIGYVFYKYVNRK